jgi:hypothetical protein
VPANWDGIDKCHHDENFASGTSSRRTPDRVTLDGASLAELHNGRRMASGC